MTRKDYILIAKAVTDTKARIDADHDPVGSLMGYIQHRGVRRLAVHLADALAADNPRFDRAIFLKACGYGA